LDLSTALSGSDRHDFVVSQGLDIANWGPTKESPVLAIELARAFVADLERRTCRIQFTREHANQTSICWRSLSGLPRRLSLCSPCCNVGAVTAGATQPHHSGIEFGVNTELSHSIHEGGSVDAQAACSAIAATDAALARRKRLYDFLALFPLILLGASTDIRS